MITNSQYNEIMRTYEQVQSHHRAKQREHIAEVYEKIPELITLDDQLGSSALKRYKAYAGGDEKAIEDFESEIKKVREKRAELLKAAGYPADYTELKYDCKLCKDTGYLEDGEKCSCLKDKERKLLYAQSKLDRILARENFGTLSFDYYDDEKVLDSLGMTQKAYMTKVVDICKGAEGNILFTGSTGVGKTFLSNCIADKMIKEGKSVIYLTAIELFDIIGQVKIDKSEDLAVKGIYERIFDCDLLIIDDLGSELYNTMTNSNLFYILNNRLTNGRMTIISTNLKLNAMRDIYSERVTSRIQSEFDIIPIYGDDIRLKKDR